MQIRQFIALLLAVVATVGAAAPDRPAVSDCAGYLPAYEELAAVLAQARGDLGGRPALASACAPGGATGTGVVRYQLEWPVATTQGMHSRWTRTCTRQHQRIRCDAPQRAASLDLTRWFTVDAALGTRQLTELMATVSDQLRPGEVFAHVGFAASPGGESWSVQDHGYLLVVARPPLGETRRLRAKLRCTDRCRWDLTLETEPP